MEVVVVATKLKCEWKTPKVYAERIMVSLEQMLLEVEIDVVATKFKCEWKISTTVSLCGIICKIINVQTEWNAHLSCAGALDRHGVVQDVVGAHVGVGVFR